jgi:hypothetical protein
VDGRDGEQTLHPVERIHQAVHAPTVGLNEKLAVGRAAVGATIGIVNMDPQLQAGVLGLEGEEDPVWDR